MSGLSVGSVVPDFALATLDGQMIALSDFRGQRLLAFMWASW
jgi:peroxiredoxin